jgi:cytochrome c6
LKLICADVVEPEYFEFKEIRGGVNMKKLIAVGVATFAMSSFAVAGMAADKNPGAGKGEELFKTHCAVCHPNGGNIINPKKPLDKKSLTANGIKSAKDIIHTMRNPGPGMNKFDEKTIPDKEAKMIADYVLKTFK